MKTEHEATELVNCETYKAKWNNIIKSSDYPTSLLLLKLLNYQSTLRTFLIEFLLI